MTLIIRSPELKHESITDYEVFHFNDDRLKIAFKGSHHLHRTVDGIGMVVKVVDASAIMKLLVSRVIPFSTEHVDSEKDVNYTSPQIKLTTKFVTDPDTQSLEYEVDMLIDVICRHRNIHDLIHHIRYQPYFNPTHFEVPHPSMPKPGFDPHSIMPKPVFQQPQGPSHYTGMRGSNFQQQPRGPGQYPGWDHE